MNVVAGTSALMTKNPMRRIITMLQDMQKELERQGEMDKEIFEKAMCVCETGDKDLQVAIDESAAAIEEYTSKIEADTAEQAQLEQEIVEHNENRDSAERDLAEATAIRTKEHKSFVAQEKDMKLNINGLSKAIPAIEKGMGGSALMQVIPHSRRFRRMFEVTKYLSPDARSGVLAFLNEGSDDESNDSDQASNSGEILGIMKNMKEEMEKDLAEMQATEKSTHETFNELKTSKTEEISINEKAVISKEKRIGEIKLSLSEGKHALEDSQEENENAKKFLANMKEDCANKEKERDMRAKMRTEEIAAIGDAIKILNDDSALETFSKAKSAALVQRPVKTYDAFIQMHEKVKRVTGSHAMSSQSGESSSQPEDAQAEKIVSTMINGMVAVLHDEDVSDEHKKAWCFNETAVSAGIKAEKKDILTKTEAQITEQEDKIATLAEEIKALTIKIQELDKLVHDTTKQRKEEHQEFVDGFATSATAIRLVNKAIKRLEKFYSPEKFAAEKKAATDAALAKAGLSLLSKSAASQVSEAAVQHVASALLPGGFDFMQVGLKVHMGARARIRAAIRSGVDPVEMADTPGGYQKSESGGVIGLMNEFVTELKMEMTEGETEEKFNAKDYVRIMTDAQETRQQDTKSLNEKKAAKSGLDTKLMENKELKEMMEEQLHNLELYIVQVHGECDYIMRNFETRHEGRVDGEIGLKTAETIVTEETPPSHRQVADQFDAEKSDKDVQEHFPDAAIVR